MKSTYQPLLQDFHIEGVRHISPEDAFKSLDNENTVLIDVRESYETNIDWIDHAHVEYYPMSVILDRLEDIAKQQNIIVVCRAGVRSSKIVNLLNMQGYPSAFNLDGGILAWKAKGLPCDSVIETGDGCDCNGGCSGC
jgi:rhodanese-related sulfurtransferase